MTGENFKNHHCAIRRIDRSRALGFMAAAIVTVLMAISLVPAAAHMDALEESVKKMFLEAEDSGCQATLAMVRHARNSLVMMSSTTDTKSRESIFRRTETFLRAAQDALDKWNSKKQMITRELTDAEKALKTGSALPGIPAADLNRLKTHVSRVRDYLVKKRYNEGAVLAEEMKKVASDVVGRAVDRNTTAAETRELLRQGQTQLTSLNLIFEQKPLRRIRNVLDEAARSRGEAEQALEMLEFSLALEKAGDSLKNISRAKKIADAATNLEIGASKNLLELAGHLEKVSEDPSRTAEATTLRKSIVYIDSAIESGEQEKAYRVSISAMAPYRLAGIIRPQLLMDLQGASAVGVEPAGAGTSTHELRGLLKELTVLMASQGKIDRSSKLWKRISDQVSAVESDISSGKVSPVEADGLKQRMIVMKRILQHGDPTR